MAKNTATNTIMVERETYTKGDREFYTYFVRGMARGREFRAAVMPPDKGGYTVLDIVFGDAMQAELVVTPFEFKDDTGNAIKGNSFMVRSVDADGTVYECPIKPMRQSDKAMLKMIVG